jgi:site-specific DNA recombinase
VSLKVSETLSIFLKEAILEEFANNTTYLKERKIALVKQLSGLQNKLTKARELLLTGNIESSDYRIIKQDCDEQVSVIESNLEDLNSKVYSVERLEPIISRALSTLAALDLIYCKSTI